MQGARIIARYLGFGDNGYTPVMPGEPVFDPATKRFGMGIGGYKAVWYPKATPEGDLQFDDNQGLVSSDGVYSLRFTTTGLSWKSSGVDVLTTRGSNGVAIRTGMVMQNSAGQDVVVVGYGHYVALIAMLMNIKALLRKMILGTATNADVAALFTPDPASDLATLNPSFPEGPSL